MEPAPVVDPTAPATGGCPFPHAALTAAPSAAVAGPSGPAVPSEPIVEPAADSEARCPVPHAVASLAPGCPVRHDGSAPPVERSAADRFVRRLLFIKDRPAGVTNASAYSTFQRSMLISATRCTLTYVVFPIVLPGISILKGVGPVLGILIGTLALVCDTFTIRRFFAVDHKWRWHFSAIAFGIMCLLTVLLVQDVSHLIGELT